MHLLALYFKSEILFFLVQFLNRDHDLKTGQNNLDFSRLQYMEDNEKVLNWDYLSSFQNVENAKNSFVQSNPDNRMPDNQKILIS
jgi:hypothetical protein